jgi:serine/threonine protein kinase
MVAARSASGAKGHPVHDKCEYLSAQMNLQDEAPPSSSVAMSASRPPAAEGAVRRLGHALLQARLFGAPRPTLGRFQVQRKIGEGGMGAVFEALDPTLGRTVALKVLREPARRASSVDIGNEARMLARLSHPNVVTVYELGDEAGEYYVCMEHVDGPHLAAWIAAHPEASWRTRVGHLLGAASGLAAAHRAGVIHRDFKLENVLVGSDGVARVTDFGLARADVASPADVLGPPRRAPSSERSAGGDSGSTAAGEGVQAGADSSLAGTPGYVAPEVLRGGRASEKSDQYSFFVALRAALRGVEGTEPAVLGDLIHTGMSRDPSARLLDMRAVVVALETVLSRRPAPDQRARDVLSERVQRLWVEPGRARALLAHGTELPLRCEPVEGLVAGEAIDLGGGASHEIAAALHTMLASVVLVGAPGAGKTIRLLGVADALLRRGQGHDGVPLPVVLNLSSFPAFRGSFLDWLQHEMVAKYALPREQVRQWLDDGRLALLLDGLDEVGAPDRGRCAEALNQLRAERPSPYLVTCREENYRGLLPRLQCDAVVRLCPIDVSTLDATLDLASAPARVAALVRGDAALAEQLRNPFLLTLFTQLAGELDAPSVDGGALRERLYSLSLAHSLDRAPRLSGEQRERATAAVRWLAAAMTRGGVTELWLEEMQAGWMPRRSQRVAAYALGMGAAFSLSIAVNLAAARVAQQPWYSGLFFGVIAVVAAFVIQGGVRIVPMEAMRWSWPRLRTWIPRNLLLGIVTGGLHGSFFDLVPDLMLGVATGLLGLSVIGLVPAGRERRVNPGDGLAESLRNSLLVAPLIGLVIGVPVGYVVLPLARPFASAASMYHTHPNPELAWAVTMGTSAAVTSLFITGFLAPVMHAALRLTIAATSPLPLRLTPWLDTLADRDLLHRVGGGWVFRHSTFRAWLYAGGVEPRRGA